MKTKLIAMQWRGSASVDPRFSSAMLPWSIADIYSRDQFLNVSSKFKAHHQLMFSCNELMNNFYISKMYNLLVYFVTFK